MQDAPDTPDERLQRRRIRRWKRRARILGPFLGVPILLLTLSLSVDLIEYRPHPESNRLADQPLQMPLQQNTQPSVSVRPSLLAISDASALIPTPADDTLAIGGDSIDLDVTLPSASWQRSPTPPYVVNRR